MEHESFQPAAPEQETNPVENREQAEAMGEKSLEAARNYLEAAKAGKFEAKPREEADIDRDREIANRVNWGSQEVRDAANDFKEKSQHRTAGTLEQAQRYADAKEKSRAKLHEVVERETERAEEEYGQEKNMEFDNKVGENGEDSKELNDIYEKILEQKSEVLRQHEDIVLGLEIQPDDSPEAIDTKVEAIEMAEKIIAKIETDAKIKALRVLEARKRVAAIKAKRQKPAASPSQGPLPTEVIS